MKKKYFIKTKIILLLFANCLFFNINAQVVIGTNKKPETFSVLELISNANHGLKIDILLN